MEKLLLLLKLLPAIIQAMKAIEEAIQVSGFGSQKLQALRQILEQTDSSVSQIWPSIENAVKVLVNLFNATGVFKTKQGS